MKLTLTEIVKYGSGEESKVEYRKVYETPDKNAFTVGRSPENDVVIEDVHTFVSRVHCIVYRTETGYEVEDNESRNGTFIDGERIPVSKIPRKRARLENRSVLSLGESFGLMVKIEE